MGKVLLGIVCLLSLHVSTASALRCGTELVSESDRKFEVVRKCGDPVSIESWTVYDVVTRRDTRHRFYVEPGESVEPITVEEWIYNFGPHRLMYWLRFENGSLVKIGTLGYGY